MWRLNGFPIRAARHPHHIRHECHFTAAAASGARIVPRRIQPAGYCVTGPGETPGAYGIVPGKAGTVVRPPSAQAQPVEGAIVAAGAANVVVPQASIGAQIGAPVATGMANV